MDYPEFLELKSQSDFNHGFKPLWIPDWLFDFQKYLTDWSIRKGRGAVFADCGMGKGPMALVWAQNIVEKTNKPVLFLTPLAVAPQIVREGEKFGVDCEYSRDGKFKKRIVATNYERLHLFDKNDFPGVVCDESSILKNPEGITKDEIIRFMRKIPYRLLCTATAAPNDYPELGTSSEALGCLGFMDMLNKFFKNQQSTIDTRRHWARNGGPPAQWRFKKHAEMRFWKWICSWARACRKPSDFGFDDNGFILPELILKEHVVDASRPLPGKLFVEPAIGLYEQRQERKSTLVERCDLAIDLVKKHRAQSIIWCTLNAEGDYMTKHCPNSVHVKGSDSMDHKEESFLAFQDGQIENLITKQSIGGFGLNLQNCHHMTYFPDHSYERFYQGTRRCWRFGQEHDVTVDIVTTKGEMRVLKNLERKAEQADKMFSMLVKYMNDAESISRLQHFNKKAEVPSWLLAN